MWAQGVCGTGIERYMDSASAAAQADSRREDEQITPAHFH